MQIKIWCSKLLKDKTDNVFIQLFRYLISGASAFLIDTGIMILLKETIGMHYLQASIIGFIVGVIYTYMLSISWIFDQRRVPNQWLELFYFSLIAIVGLGLTWFFMKFFTETLFTHYIVSKILTTIIVSLWNFIAKKILLFTNKKY